MIPLSCLEDILSNYDFLAIFKLSILHNLFNQLSMWVDKILPSFGLYMCDSQLLSIVKKSDRDKKSEDVEAEVFKEQ